MIWEARNDIVTRGEFLSLQRLKSFFLLLLWSETKLFFANGPMTFVHFIDWVGSK